MQVMKTGYDADEESSGQSYFLHLRPYNVTLQRKPIKARPVRSANYFVDKHYNSQPHGVHFFPSIARRRRRAQNDKETRMVLEPKFADYGTIHTVAEVPEIQQHNSSHALLSPRSVLSLPPLEDEDTPDTSKGTKSMTQGDLYQRQPLLPNPAKGEKRINGSHPTGYTDEDEEVLHNSDASNGVIKINMPAPVREEPRFPQEFWKTAIAGVILIFNFIVTLAALAVTHDKVPDRATYAPLPDVFMDNSPALDWGLNVSEYIIMVSVNSCFLIILFHKHRFIIFRRAFLIMSVLYLYRGITLYVTVLPVASKTYYCSPKSNDTTPLIVAQRVIHMMIGFGLSVNGRHTYCGDFIFSGHTVTLVLSYLFIAEYTPKKLYIIHWVYWALAFIGVIMLQLSHGHYTVDVIIAYYITTRMFWIYHALANNSSLKQHGPNNYLGRMWWFGAFMFFERNVTAPVPRQWPDWPLPWPRRCHSKSRDS